MENNEKNTNREENTGEETVESTASTQTQEKPAGDAAKVPAGEIKFNTVTADVKVKCPKCGGEVDFKLYRNIVATEENGLAGRVKDGSLFLTYCPHCSQKINVDHTFIYHNVDDGFLVHYCANDDDLKNAVNSLTKPADAEKPVVAALAKKSSIIRLVRTREQLLEKMCIYDAGMDDRAIEILKHFVAGSFLKDNPDKKIDNIYFNVIKSDGQDAEEGKKILSIIVDGKQVAISDVTEQVYKQIFDGFVSGMPPLRADHNIIVNPGWAKNVIELRNAKPNPAE